MSKKATATDAQLIMKLYDLRREAEMRKARNWWVVEFWPQNADDCMKVVGAMGSEENNWLRQVGGYWSMAASFVLQGALNEEMFIQPAVSGEMYFLFAKVHPFLKELREKLGDPNFLGTIEKVINHSKFGRDRLQFTLKRVSMMREKRAAARVTPPRIGCSSSRREWTSSSALPRQGSAPRARWPSASGSPRCTSRGSSEPRSSTSASGAVQGSTTEKTWNSRMRRAMSCVYCEPKSRITIVEVPGVSTSSV